MVAEIFGWSTAKYFKRVSSRRRRDGALLASDWLLERAVRPPSAKPEEVRPFALLQDPNFVSAQPRTPQTSIMASDTKTAIVPPKRANTDYPVRTPSLSRYLNQLTFSEPAYRFRPVWTAPVPAKHCDIIAILEPNAYN